MFVDASAIVAILSGEPERAVLVSVIDEAEAPITSALAVFEAVAAVARKKKQTVADSEGQVGTFLRSAQVAIVSISEQDGAAALTAFRRYGKGRGHPAQLNMGDCFAYACARVRNVPLLFVGNDFARTDIPSAIS